MYFLTHIYLSGNSPSCLAGNFIGEIKTTHESSLYSDNIQYGISFHHAIDEFTNAHPIVANSRKRLNPKFSKYADLIIDVFYDHFLAANWSQYSNQPLEKFISNSYCALLHYHNILPYKGKKILPLMIKNNWLSKFTSISGVHQSMLEIDLTSMKAPNTQVVFALKDLIENYSEFKKDFDEFFPQLISMCRRFEKINEIKANSGNLALAG